MKIHVALRVMADWIGREASHRFQQRTSDRKADKTTYIRPKNLSIRD